MLFSHEEIPMRRTNIVILAAVAVFVMMVSHGAAEQYQHPKTGIVFPDTINALKLVKVTDYEPLYAGLGSGISYRTETMRADIFLYDMKQAVIPDGVSSPVTDREFDQAFSDILEMEKRGTYKNISVATKKEIVPVGNLKFIHSVLTYEQNNIKLVSHLYLTGCRGLFMKFRITCFASARQAEEVNFTAFLSKMDDITRVPPR